MASVVAKLLDKIAGKKEMRVLIVGLDAAGKTTILYKLKLDEVITTIPTIGFNVETFKYKDINFTMWDVGGRDKIRPLWRHYYQNTQAVIMVIDSNDRERLNIRNDESDPWITAEGSMYDMLQEDELKSAPLFIFANKQDLPNAMSVKEITEKLELNERIKNRPWHIQGCCAKTGEGLYEMMDIIRDTLINYQFDQKAWDLKIENRKKIILLISGYIRETVKNSNISSHIPSAMAKLVHFFHQDPNEIYDEYTYYGDLVENNDRNADHLKRGKPELLIEFLQRKESYKDYIVDDDQFIEWFGKKKDFVYDDKKWEHFDFIRMIWILFKKYQRKEGLKMIWKLSVYNVTKTYFWSQLIYFGMHCTKDNNLSLYIQTDFEYFLILNPCLSNNYNDLIKKYYSETLLKQIENEKKDEMVLPDIMALPSIVTDIEKLKKQKNVNVVNQEIKSNDGDDGVFINNFEKRAFKSWEGHKSFLRVIWCYVDQYNGTQQAVKKIMNEWKIFKGDNNYHETKTYFWIHMVRYWRVLYKEHVNAQSVNTNDIEWNFNGFLNFCNLKRKKAVKCKILNDDWWKEYYSQNVMNHKGFNGIDASKNMIFPDIKQLPQLQFVSKQKK